MLLGAREVFLFFNPKVIEGFYLFGETEKAAEYIYKGETAPVGNFVSNYLYGLLYSSLAGVAISLFVTWKIANGNRVHWLNLVFLSIVGLFCSFLFTRIRFNFHQLSNYFFDFYGLIGVKEVLLLNALLLLIASFYILIWAKNKKDFYQHST
jgi:hypothetical protein